MREHQRGQGRDHPRRSPRFLNDVEALGTVLEDGRGSLPFALIHGEALVACAVWALGEAGITPLDVGTAWPALAESGLPLVLHDALCPMVPASFLRACLDLADERSAVVVGVRPVTDTIKTVSDGMVGATVDREGLFSVASPVVLPPAVVEALEELPTTDLPELAGLLARRFPVLTLPAPADGRRVRTLEDVRLLEALTARRP